MRKLHIGILFICLLFINNINNEEISKNENETEKNTNETLTKTTENKINVEDSNLAIEKIKPIENLNEDKKAELTETNLEKKEEKLKKTEEQSNTEVNTPIIEKAEENSVEDIPKEKIQNVEEKIEKAEEKIEKTEEKIEKTEEKIEKTEEKIDDVEINQTEIVKTEEIKEKVKEEEETMAPIATTNLENNTNTENVENLSIDEKEKNKTSWKTLTMFIISVIFISGLLILVFLSIYYRIYMFRKRTAPFEVPRILSALFPKPINYEHEITILCSKYMNN